MHVKNADPQDKKSRFGQEYMIMRVLEFLDFAFSPMSLCSMQQLSYAK